MGGGRRRGYSTAAAVKLEQAHMSLVLRRILAVRARVRTGGGAAAAQLGAAQGNALCEGALIILIGFCSRGSGSRSTLR